MTIRTVNRTELKEIAHDLFGMIVADLRSEVTDLRAENKMLKERVITLNAQFVAFDNRLKNELSRSEKSRQAILKRLGEVENMRLSA